MPLRTLVALIQKEAEASWSDEMQDLKAELMENKPVSCLHIFFGWTFHFAQHLCGWKENKKD